MSVSEKLITVSENQEKIYQAGKNKEYDTFWDAYQQKGRRTSYINGFYGAGWTDDNFRPKYDIVVSGSGGWMFNNAKITKIKDVKLDISRCTDVQAMFYGSSFEELPELDMSGAGDLRNTFYNAKKLKSIAKLKLGTVQEFTKTFYKCISLRDITIDGTISRSIDFSDCPLSVESMINIISSLEHYRDTDNMGIYTVKFSESCWDALESSGIPADSIVPDVPNWSEACIYKGWNI